jgi:uncharacterized protein YukE
LFIELSKDKSLGSMLKKANLDSETQKLIGSHPSIIKASLVKNMNDNNIVQYRRLIQKADEEEEARREAEREAEQEYQTQLGGRSSYGAGGAGVGNVDEETLEDKIERESMAQVEYGTRMEIGKFNEIYKEYKLLNDILPALKKLSDSVELEDSVDTPTKIETQGDEEFFRIRNKKDSNTIYNVMKQLSENREFLRDNNYVKGEKIDPEDENSPSVYQLVSPEPPAKEKEGKLVSRRKKAPINVSELEEGYLELIDKKIQDKTFMEVFKIMHTNRFGFQPAGEQNKRKLSRLFTQSKEQLLGIKSKDLQNILGSLKNVSNLIEDNKKMQEVIEKQIDKLREMDADNYKTAVARLEREFSREMESPNMDSEKLRELQSQARKLRMGEMSDEEMASLVTKEIEEQVEAELAKLTALQEDLYKFVEYEEDIKDAVETLSRFMKFPIPSEKELKAYRDGLRMSKDELQRVTQRFADMDVEEDKQTAGKRVQLMDTVEREIEERERLVEVKSKYSRVYKKARKNVRKVGSAVDRLARNFIEVNKILERTDEINAQTVAREMMTILRVKSAMGETESDVKEIKGLDVVEDNDARKLQRLYDAMFQAVDDLVDSDDMVSESLIELEQAQREEEELKKKGDEEE